MSRQQPENLYREQALAALRRAPVVQPVLGIPQTWRRLSLLLLTGFVVAALLSPFIRYHRVVAVAGRLVPESGVVQTASQQTAVVESLAVSVGDVVAKGKVLMTLTPTSTLADGSRSADHDRQRIVAALAEIDQQAAALESRQHFEREALEGEQRLHEQQAAALQQQIRLQQQRIRNSRNRLARLQAAGDAVAEWERLTLHDELAGREAQLTELTQRLTSLGREVLQRENRRQASASDTAIAESRLRERRGELQLSLRAETQARSVVAGIDGTVADIYVRAGEVAAAGRTLLTIVPRDAELVAELRVPDDAAARLQSGLPLRLAIDAFPPQQFGWLQAEVRQTAHYVSDAVGIPAGPGMARGAYRVLATFERSELSLKPGMAVSAELLLEQQTLLQWFLQAIRPRAS